MSWFENGGLPAPGLYGLTEVLHTYMRLGADDIQEYILSLGDYLRQKIRDIPEVSEAFHFEREHSSNLIMLEVPERLELTGAKLRKCRDPGESKWQEQNPCRNSLL